MRHRDIHVARTWSLLEKEMEYLGVTGVEDKLQDEVEGTIDALKQAGIQVWMLTGDKVETATSIAISSGLKSRKDALFFMREIVTPTELVQKVQEFTKKSPQNTTLIIDGTTLQTILDYQEASDAFFTATIQAACVCVCRCSPVQKAELCKALRLYIGNKRIAAIGDGGNDVGMLLESDVGIGIEGKEGISASLASDFSLKEFSQLRKLILWHGRLSYRRSTLLTSFVFHRGLVISVIQAFFVVLFYFVQIPIYNGFLMLGYDTIYTAFPVFAYLIDADTNIQSALNFPPLYKSLQKGRSLNFKNFCVWIWKSVYQGSIIILFAIIAFNDSFVNIVTITFTSLILIELLNVYTQVHSFNIKMIMIMMATITTYFMTITLLQSYFKTGYINDIFFLKVGAIALGTWAPIQFMSWLVELMDPSEHNKLSGLA